jgi:hypothetical protein
MNKSLKLGVVLCLVAGVVVAGSLAVKRAAAAAPEKFIHVRVNDSSKGEMVSINLPLSLAEKVLPTIHNGQVHDGKVSISGADMHDVDLHALLAAVADAPDNEFVTVKEKDQEVRVAKSNGNFVIHVIDKSEDGDKKDEKRGQTVDITVPISIVKAMVPDGNHEVDLVAAIHALGEAGSSLLVSIHDGTEEVKIWVDSENNSTK